MYKCIYMNIYIHIYMCQLMKIDVYGCMLVFVVFGISQFYSKKWQDSGIAKLPHLYFPVLAKMTQKGLGLQSQACFKERTLGLQPQTILGYFRQNW